MQKIKAIFFVALIVLAQSGQSQGFINLNFESANVSGYSIGDSIPTSSALPDWSAYFINSDGRAGKLTIAAKLTQKPNQNPANPGQFFSPAIPYP